MSKKQVISPEARRSFETRNAKARRLMDRAKELEKSGAATDKRVARELFIEARELSAAVIRDLEKASPELKALAKILAKARKRKAST